MKRITLAMGLALSALILLSTTSESETTQWFTDFESAKTAAKADNKIVMMSFQGSDWCNNCRRLEKTLFENEKFASLAKSDLILLKVDFPMKKANKLSKEQTAHNDALAEKYNSDGSFPKVVFFDGDGNKLGTMNYPEADVDSYITEIKTFIK